YQKNRLHLTIDGEAYDGAVTREWDPTGERWVTTFSVVGTEGVPLWGSALAPLSDQEIVDAVATDLTLPGTGSVVADLDLPTVGTHGASIAWTSSDESAVTADGTVPRPSQQHAS